MIRQEWAPGGRLEVLQGVYSPQLNNRRDILVYLPPSYGLAERRYPVIYMHDGQNLFDDATSYAGAWHVDKTIEELQAQQIEALVVGVPNMGSQRLAEYSPFADKRYGGGQGQHYLAFLAETLKPLIDRRFLTLPKREHTGVLGSSMGGLISLYAFFQYPRVFGFAGVLSPSLWYGERAIFASLERAARVPGKLYLDVGTGEGAEMLDDARRMRQLLRAKGYRPGRDLYYHEDEGAGHSEAAWGGRLYRPLAFLLQGAAAPSAAPGPWTLGRSWRY